MSWVTIVSRVTFLEIATGYSKFSRITWSKIFTGYKNMSRVTFYIFCSLEKSTLHILILMCPRGVFLHQIYDKKVTRDTFWGCHGLLFWFITGYIWCHGLVLAKLSRAMSRLTLALKNATGYFFEKCHGLVEKCHGEKKKLCTLLPSPPPPPLL